jgi:hypothetical protein
MNTSSTTRMFPALLALREEFGYSILQAIDAFSERYERLRETRPLEFTVSREDYARTSTRRVSRPPDLFVPKPSRGADCQPCGTPDLGPIVRQRPLVSPAGGGDCYSVGYSVARSRPLRKPDTA